MHLIFRLLITTAALFGIAYLVPGFHVDSMWTALIAALVIGVINAVLRPILTILTLPITILTLGLFSIVINALLLWLASSLVPGFSIDTFWSAALSAILLWVVSLGTNWLLKND
ncbi:phage holin family protein [Candidatus Uhrbacteria bacterium]|nr:phage holin family protein [Candidatus Uhrbacteria bacterium]